MNESNANPIDILAQDLAPVELQTDEDKSYARKITEKILELLEEKDYKRVMKLVDKPKRADNPEYQALLVKMRLTDPYQDLRFLAVTDRLSVIKNLMHIIEALPNPNLSVHTEVQGIDRNGPISRDSIRELMQEYIGKKQSLGRRCRHSGKTLRNHGRKSRLHQQEQSSSKRNRSRNE